jgi:hypothetical protein
MATSTKTYKNLSLGLILIVIALLGALIFQLNKNPEIVETSEQQLTDQQLIQEYRDYANSYYNLEESSAIRKASKDGLTARVTERTNKDIIRTLDGTPNRLHLTIKDGKVIRAQFEFYPQ